MGYYLYITRWDAWNSDEEEEISPDEWLEYVEHSPDFELGGINGPYFAEWQPADASKGFWVDWRDGQLYSKNPGYKEIRILQRIARDLDAFVQGEHGEFYDGSSVIDSQTGERRSLRPTIADRLVKWAEKHQEESARKALPELKFGDRVVDRWGNKQTVIKIDPDIPNHIRSIHTRCDNGMEWTTPHFNHGLHLLSEAETTQKRMGILDRIARVISPPKPDPYKAYLEPLNFKVGDRVLDHMGREHTVLEIDKQAFGGFGLIRTRTDDDEEHETAAMAHGLRRVDPE